MCGKERGEGFSLRRAGDRGASFDLDCRVDAGRGDQPVRHSDLLEREFARAPAPGFATGRDLSAGRPDLVFYGHLMGGDGGAHATGDSGHLFTYRGCGRSGARPLGGRGNWCRL